MDMIAWVQAHPFETLAAYYVFSAAIGALQMPTRNSSAFYRWFFMFSNALSANVTRAFAAKYPQQVNGGKDVGTV